MIDFKQWMIKGAEDLKTVKDKTSRRVANISADSSFSTTTFIAEIHRIGNIAILYMNILIPALTASTERTMFTIPSSYFTPTGKMNFTVNGQVNAMYLIQVYADGHVSIYSQAATTTQFLRGTLVIPCSGG